MDIESRELPDCRVYRLKGNLEIYATEDVKDLLIAHLQENPAPRVILNFREVEFVDSSGLGILMNMQFRFKETRFRFCHVRENIRQAMEYTNLASFFQIDGSEDESQKRAAEAP